MVSAGPSRTWEVPNHSRMEMHVARRPENRLSAALYDPMSRPLEHGMIGEAQARLLAELTGEALDVGAGTGVNRPHLHGASRVAAAEPAPAIRRRIAAKLTGAPAPVQPTGDTAQALDANRGRVGGS